MKYSKEILNSKVISANYKEKYIKTNFPKWYEDILKFQKEFNFEDFTFNQLLYHYCNDITDRVVCRSGKPKTFGSFCGGYSAMCIDGRHCKTCMEDLNNNAKKTNIKKYGAEYHMKTEKSKINQRNKSKQANEKRRKTCIEKYGVDNVYKTKSAQDKYKQTCLKRYGTDNPNKNKEIRRKTEQTNIERYGVKVPLQSTEIQHKLENTNIEKYGAKCVFQSEKIKTKIKNITLERYGETNVMRNDSIFEKCTERRFRRKQYVFPSGNIVEVQGYENYAIDYLLNNGVNETNIFISSKNFSSKIGKIYYELNEKQHRYFPDIVVNENNEYIIYEIKSLYTYKLGQENNELELKMKACNEAGYDAVIQVFDNKGNLLFENKYNKQDNE